MTGSDARDHLIVALDVPTIADAAGVVQSLGDSVYFYKIGYQLAFVGGIDFARELKQAGKRIFLDMKLLDIDNTVARGVEQVASLGFDFLTIHAYPKAMRAAVAAAAGSDLRLLAVTVMTSMADDDLTEAFYHDDARSLVLKRARQAADAGMGGIVCAAAEVDDVRAAVGARMAMVTPGIRPSGADAGDQRRVMSPGAALRAGASHLVVGRPVVAAEDRAAAARAIIAEMEAVLAQK